MNLSGNSFLSNPDQAKSLKLPSKQDIKLQYFPINKKTKLALKALDRCRDMILYAILCKSVLPLSLLTVNYHRYREYFSTLIYDADFQCIVQF